MATLLVPAPASAGTLDVVLEEVEDGRVRLRAVLPHAGDRDPQLRLLELATTATLRSALGPRLADVLAGRVLELGTAPAGAEVTVDAELVRLGRTVVVRAVLRDAAGQAVRESVLTAVVGPRRTV